MSDNIDEVIENLKQPSLWSRIVIMAGFAFVIYLVFVPAIILLAMAQALFAVITGASNRNLRGLASVLEQYMSQIISFITYNSDLKPFPFSEFPDADLPDAGSAAFGKTESKSSAQDKPSTKKAAAKKTPASGKSEKSEIKKPAKKAAAKKKAVKKSEIKKPAAKKSVKTEEASDAPKVDGQAPAEENKSD